MADWPILNALLNTASGATWVSLPPRRRRGHGLLAARRHGDGRRRHRTRTRRRLERVLTNDPGMGVMRHADAGYARAVEVAQERGLDLPMRE